MTASAACAQQPDISQLEVHYKFFHVQDTNRRDQPYTEKMVLLVGKRSGVYKSGEAGLQEQITNNPDGTIQKNSHRFGSPAEYYQYPNEKKLLRKDNIFQSEFLIADALPPIDWQIKSDTTTIGGLHCQKATTHFKGRDYTAWFCPDLPLHLGPWKLNGLPGVIIEATDAKNEIRFMFAGATKSGGLTIQPSDIGIKTTEKEFARLQDIWQKDPQAFLDGMAKGSGRPAMKVDIKPGPGRVFNNPIELPEHRSQQHPDSAKMTIHYRFTHIQDTNHRDKPHTENMVLLVGERSGLYRTNEPPAQHTISTNPDGTTRIDTRESAGTHVEYYQFPNEKRLVRRDYIPMAHFLITDALPAIDWQIKSDTATYASLHCQKATTHFKGRDYTAWFCADLPVPVGPWKLNGLPGVIVEAQDEKQDVRFSFEGIDKPDPIAILPPEKGVRTTDKEFAKLEEMSHKDPAAYSKLMAQYNDNDGPSHGPTSGSVINNPIELPEKK
jgi:GLPGLI family protein